MAMKPVPTFARGDLVRWTSQGRGSARHHVGVVVLELPGGVTIDPFLEGLGKRYSLRAMQRSHGPRPERSYLVALTGAGGRGRARLHWPHASLLEPYTTQDEGHPLAGAFDAGAFDEASE